MSPLVEAMNAKRDEKVLAEGFITPSSEFKVPLRSSHESFSATGQRQRTRPLFRSARKKVSEIVPLRAAVEPLTRRFEVAVEKKKKKSLTDL